jgi:hypothetical protein
MIGMQRSHRGSPAGGIYIALPGYSLHGLALWAEWKLRSASGVLGVALLITALTCVLFSRFTRFRASGLGVLVEAHRDGAQQSRVRKVRSAS